MSKCDCDCDYVRTLNVTVIRERDEARAQALADLHSLQSAHEALADAVEAQSAALRERDEARAEAKEMREILETAGQRLKACGYELTEFSYQELASVLLDLPSREGEP